MALQEELEKQGNWLFRYRGILPLFLLVSGIIVYTLTNLHQDLFIHLNGTIYHKWFCLFIGLIGLLIRVFTVGFTPANTSGRNTRTQLADELNKTGIYSIVRHPLYLGNFFMWLSIALLTENGWFVIVFILAYWIYYERIMFAEEQFLRKKFGDTYLIWSAQVPAFLPSFDFSEFKKPGVRFSWKKVVKKEKNGLFALFLIFFYLMSWVNIYPIITLRWSGNFYQLQLWQVGSFILY
jgi:protein-S-isoprenylcysteine O-methyltransferase Ste14